MRIQIWTYSYDPEPQGIAPLSRIVAVEFKARGHEVLVVAAHPHYPQPQWGYCVKPYREVRDGISILRLPLWFGGSSSVARVGKEVSFTLMQSLVTPILPNADVLLAVTPSFPALAPAMAYSKLRGVPWVMWLQDIVTDAAETTGLLPDGPLMDLARRFELMSYSSADRVVVISEAFRQNLLAKQVDERKIEHVFNPAPRKIGSQLNDANSEGLPRVLVMGNIGHSQGLEAIVEAFQDSEELSQLDAELRFAGHGVAAGEVTAKISVDRIQMLGVLDGDDLDAELRAASLGLVSQRGDIAEFNFPSKLMNYMACGVPVLASVNPNSETARVVRESGAGWVTDAREPAAFAAMAAAKLRDPAARAAAGQAGFAYAKRNFDPSEVASRLETILGEVVHECPDSSLRSTMRA